MTDRAQCREGRCREGEGGRGGGAMVEEDGGRKERQVQTQRVRYIEPIFRAGPTSQLGSFEALRSETSKI